MSAWEDYRDQIKIRRSEEEQARIKDFQKKSYNDFHNKYTRGRGARQEEVQRAYRAEMQRQIDKPTSGPGSDEHKRQTAKGMNKYLAM